MTNSKRLLYSPFKKRNLSFARPIIFLAPGFSPTSPPPCLLLSTAYLYDICAYYLAACIHTTRDFYSTRVGQTRVRLPRDERSSLRPPFSLLVYPRRGGGINSPVSGEIISSLSLSLFLFDRCLIPFLFLFVSFFLVNRENGRGAREGGGER